MEAVARVMQQREFEEKSETQSKEREEGDLKARQQAEVDADVKARREAEEMRDLACGGAGGARCRSQAAGDVHRLQ